MEVLKRKRNQDTIDYIRRSIMTKRKKRSLAEVMGREMEQRKKDMLFEHEVRKYFKKHKILPTGIHLVEDFKVVFR